MTRTVTRHGRTFEVKTLDTGPDVPARKYRAQRRHFTIIPKLWEETLGRACADGCTYTVAIVLLYEAAMLKLNGREPVLSLTSERLRHVQVDRNRKAVALRQLQELKLIGVEQSPGRNPIVSVYFLD